MIFFVGFLAFNIYLARTMHPDQKPPYSHLVDYTPILGGFLITVLYGLGAEGMAFFTTPMIVVSWACIWYGSFSVLRNGRL